MRAAKVQASLGIRAVSPEPLLIAHTSSESRGTFRQKARSLASLNGWACAVKTCRDGMLEDTNSLDGAQLVTYHDGVFSSVKENFKRALSMLFPIITSMKPGIVINKRIYEPRYAKSACTAHSKGEPEYYPRSCENVNINP